MGNLVYFFRMILELRIQTLEDLSSVDISPFQVVSLGDEGCLWHLPPEGERKTWIDAILSQNAGIRFVFPKVEEKYMEYVCRYTEKLVDEFPEVILTLNDLGHIYQMKELLCRKSFTIGRLLSTSMENLVWAEIFLDGEEGWVKEVLTQNNLNSDLKISFFKNLGAEGMESNLLPFQEKCFSSIREKGLKILAHYNNILLSLSRFCPLKRYVGKKPPGCAKECALPWLIKLSERNLFYKVAFEKYPDIILCGKGIYRRNPRKLCDYLLQDVDVICLDAHYIREIQGTQEFEYLLSLS